MQDNGSSSCDSLIETWTHHVKGFRKMGISFKKSWSTCTQEGFIEEKEHQLDFFARDLQ